MGAYDKWGMYRLNGKPRTCQLWRDFYAFYRRNRSTSTGRAVSILPSH